MLLSIAMLAPLHISQAAPNPTPACTGIAPTPNATTNRLTIQGCLNATSYAKLAPGLFDIDGVIDVPVGGLLEGDTTRPTIRLASNSAMSNTMIRPHAQAAVRFLTLDANHQLLDAHSSVVMINDSDIWIHDNIILGAKKRKVDADAWATNGGPDFIPADDPRALAVWGSGIYIFGGQERSMILRNTVRDNFYGVNFADDLTELNHARVWSNTIMANECDSITLRSYGHLRDNWVHHNGFACRAHDTRKENNLGSGGIYVIQNTAGGRVENNFVESNCGSGFDIHESKGPKESERLALIGNYSRDPGFQGLFDHPVPGRPDVTFRNFCNGAAAFFLDVVNVTATGNTFLNYRETNTLCRCGASLIYGPSAAIGDFADVPGGQNTVIAFVLARSNSQPNVPTNKVSHVVRNKFHSNRMSAYCTSPCVPLAAFVSRSTGYESGKVGPEGTMNEFLDNQIGELAPTTRYSVRGGFNNWAGLRVCPQDIAQQDPLCNSDDFQLMHNQPTVEWNRSETLKLDYAISTL